jgi:hypothetical protein
MGTCPCKEHGLSEVPYFDGTGIFVPAAFLPEHFWLIRSFTEILFRIFTEQHVP